MAHRPHAGARHRQRGRCGRRGLGRIGRDVALPRAHRDRRARASRAPAAPRPCRTSAIPSTPCSSPRTGCGRPDSSPRCTRRRSSQDARPAGEWHAEWQAFRSLLRLAAESADAAADLVAGLTVEHDAIERTLGLSPGLARDRDAVVAAAGAVVDAAVARFHRRSRRPHDDRSTPHRIGHRRGPDRRRDRAARAAAVARHHHRSSGTGSSRRCVRRCPPCGSCASTSRATAPARPRAIRSRSPSSPMACSGWSTRSAEDASTSPATLLGGTVALELAVAASARVASLAMVAAARASAPPTAGPSGPRACAHRARRRSSRGSAAPLVRARLPRARARRTGRARRCACSSTSTTSPMRAAAEALGAFDRSRRRPPR